ncbi:hypothetical protein [Methylobacterium sp. Leaf123]|uniref:hypothetical protein n=1 Tax=Methylobacterium sp. Leaf123 TaxID=1736264 RepID=UPI000ADAF184|nr:hypothetical protein [Methylobacterium sp. Leaf123]
MPRLASVSMSAFAALLLQAMIGTAYAATILARCGPSIGQSYYFEAGVVGPGQGGWKKDGFDGGRITAYINDKEQLDILMKDGAGLKSYLAEGYKISLVSLSKDDKSFLLAAYGQGFAETYLFKINDLGVGTLAWTASKVTPLVIRTTVMTAECGPKYDITQ